MRYQIVTLAAAAALLTACESSMDKDANTSGFDNWPNPSAAEAGAVPGSAADFQKNVTDTVNFDFDKSEPMTGSADILAEQAEWLKKWPQVNVVAEGHCDVRGTTEYNMGLGERRANSVKKGLVAAGIDANRVEVVSYGKEHPVAAGMGDADHAANRRAVTVPR